MRAIPTVKYHVVRYSEGLAEKRLKLRGSVADAKGLASRLANGLYVETVEEPCPSCSDGSPVPHNGSRYCESGSIASGGSEAHCTCDLCF